MEVGVRKFLIFGGKFAYIDKKGYLCHGNAGNGFFASNQHNNRHS